MRKSPKRKSPKRRQRSKRKSPKRKSPKRKSPKRKSPKPRQRSKSKSSRMQDLNLAYFIPGIDEYSVTDALDKIYDWIRLQVKQIILKKGTKLYRTQPVECEQFRAMYDEDTGKTGTYFSTGMLIPEGMIVEYDKPMYMCEYEIKTDIICWNNKYAHEFIESKRYFDAEWLLTEEFYNDPMNFWARPYIEKPTPTQNYNHYDTEIFPIIDFFNDFENLDLVSKSGEAEVFIGEEDLNKIRFIKSHGITSVSSAINFLDMGIISLDDMQRRN